MERIQILLEPVDRQTLEQLAKDTHTSMSNVIRDLLRERVRQQRRANPHDRAQDGQPRCERRRLCGRTASGPTRLPPGWELRRRGV